MTAVDASSLATQWTDDQESSLLRATVQYKPVGMHKHFRMLAIRNYMIEQGVVNPDDKHTSISGIWEKLGTLYDLPQLDIREDSIVSNGTEDQGNSGDHWREFELPRDEYEAMMWEKRLAPEGTDSPDWSRRESTVADTDEPRSSPVSGRGSTRGIRGGGRRGRISRLQNELERERSSKRNSRAQSTTDKDQQMEDGDDGDDAQSSEEADEEESEEVEAEEKKDTGRRGGRGGKRGRGRPGRRRGG